MRYVNKMTLFLLCPMFLFGCRDASSGSSLKTLENIASSKPKFEACSGKGAIHHKANLETHPHLRSALAAVPTTIQNSFFDDLGGRIRVVNDTSLRECSASGERVDDGLSCWRRLPDKATSIEIIILKSTPTKEQYALVRAFGFVYGDILINRIIPGTISSPVTLSQRPSGHLRDFKVHLASLFLGDLIGSLPEEGQQEAISTLEKLGIPPNVSQEVDFEKRFKLFSQLPESTQDGFSSRVFAEAFHSQFCTASSAQRACKQFGNTMRSFAPYAQDITSKAWMDKNKCSDDSLSLASGSLRSSSARREWFNQHSDAVALRKNSGADNGAFVNARIAEVAQTAQTNDGSAERASSFNLNGDLLSMLQSLLTGGLSLGGGGGGIGGILNQMLGGLSGNGGGMGGLSGILSSLGLGSGNDQNLGGSGPVENQPPVNNQSNQPGSNNQPNPSGVASAQEQAGIDATNKYRQSQGKQPLLVDDQMIADCRKQAQAQVGRGLQHWLYPAGVARGENIAYGSTSGEYTVMQQWVKSPGHHANIMGNYRYIGIGNVGNQWCQRFR